jgi:heme-degrading monooxygenase HmoA
MPFKSRDQRRKFEQGGAVEVTAPPLMFVRIWQFRVPSEKTDEFRAIYGPDGEWATLFRREAGFLGTELLHSATHPNIFLTIDRWDSAEAWAAFLRAWGDEYVALDHRSKSLIVSEGEIGNFQVTAAPIQTRR